MSTIYPLGTLLENQGKCSVFLRNTQLLILSAHAHSEGYCSHPMCVCVYVCPLKYATSYIGITKEIPTNSLQYRNRFQIC